MLSSVQSNKILQRSLAATNVTTVLNKVTIVERMKSIQAIENMVTTTSPSIASPTKRSRRTSRINIQESAIKMFRDSPKYSVLVRHSRCNIGRKKKPKRGRKIRTFINSIQKRETLCILVQRRKLALHIIP
jgi:hypothetical protein